MDRVGARELRTNLAAVLRQAAAGERVVITVDGADEAAAVVNGLLPRRAAPASSG